MDDSSKPLLRAHWIVLTHGTRGFVLDWQELGVVRGDGGGFSLSGRCDGERPLLLGDSDAVSGVAVVGDGDCAWEDEAAAGEQDRQAMSTF